MKQKVEIVEFNKFLNEKEMVQWFVDNIQRLNDQGLKSKAIGLQFLFIEKWRLNNGNR